MHVNTFDVKTLEITVLHIFINNPENILHILHIQLIPVLLNPHRLEEPQRV